MAPEDRIWLALISGVCCFVFPICCCPRTEASATARCMVKQPGPVPGSFTRWLGCRGCCMRWADNTHSTVNRTPHPSAATQPVPWQPVALSWPVVIGGGSQTGQPIVLFLSPVSPNLRGYFPEMKPVHFPTTSNRSL